MNVTKPIETVQPLVFIPRHSAGEVDISITNEETGKSDTFTLAADYNNGYMVVQVAYPFTEGCSYTYEVQSLSEILLYRGKIYATGSEDLQNYNINQDLLEI